MNINEYQCFTRTTAMYPDDQAIVYCVLGLVGEAGEIAEKVKKLLRAGRHPVALRRDEAIAKELGDVAWYLARLADELNFDMHEILEINMQKLRSRKDRGQIQGDGDDR